MRRVRSQFLQSVVRLLSVVGGRGVSGGAVVASSFGGSGASFLGVGRGLGVRCGGRLVGVAALVVVAAGVLPVTASADSLANFGSFGTPNGVEGGQLIFAKGVAANQTGNGAPEGSVYVAEANANHRISQFTATGDWVRSWGWDVVRSGEHNTGVNEQQTITLGAGVTGGTFAIRWPAAANTTAAIAFNASAAEVQSALEAVSTIGVGNVSVTSPNPGGGASPGGPYTIVFQGALGGNDQAQMTTASALVGGAVTVATLVPGGGYEICQAASSPADVCKAGVSGGQAGQLNGPSGVAVDQSNGYVYVTSGNNRRVDVFSGAGEFAGAFGWDVVPGGVAQFEFCTTSCQVAGTAGAQAGNLNLSGLTAVSAPAIDPSVPGRIYVPDNGNLRVAQYSTTITGGVLTAASFDKAFGWDVIPGGVVGLESCTAVSVCQAGQTTGGGNNPGQFTAGGSPSTVAVDGDGAIYVTSGPLASGTCSAATPCRVQKFAPDASSASDFGPSSGPGQLTFTAGAANSVAALNVAVDPSNDHLFVMRRETSTTYKILEYDNTGNHVESHPSAALTASSAATISTGLAVGADGLVYANSGAANAGAVFILGPVLPPEVTIAPVTNVGTTTATFNGTVTIPEPGAPLVTTTYHFEYSSNGLDWTSVPAADAVVGDGSPGAHPVTADATGLDPGAVYAVRLVATTGSTPVTSSTVAFTADRTGPSVRMSFVDEVTQTSAHLGAHIVAEGLTTTYHFEWGPTAGYGNQVPAFERQVGNGRDVVIAKEPIDGLDSASNYHYRVVATNYCHPTDPTDTTPSTVPCVTEGPDQTFETLNQCGLTDNRCYEMVSPADKGPVGAGGDSAIVGQPMGLQVAPEEPEIAYAVAYGLADATHGSDPLYQARRDPLGWSSWQLFPAISEVSSGRGISEVAFALALADDLSCGAYVSTVPLTDDSPTAQFDDGKGLIYTRDRDGSWTLVTGVAPLAGRVALDAFLNYNVVGMGAGPSGECDRVVVKSGANDYEYPGVPGAGDNRTYVWEDGQPTYVGAIPGPGCPAGGCIVGASAGAADGAAPGSQREQVNSLNAVSDDASRVFFTAKRLAGVGAEVGKHAIFVHEDGVAPSVEASSSQTDVSNDRDSRYEIASTDGKYVFFTAKYGLAENGQSGGPACAVTIGGTPTVYNGPGCALYRYSVDDGELTDLSVPEAVTNNPSGAGVAGVVAASDDGSEVYFAARGQLTSGEGKTEVANLADDTFNIYLSSDPSLSGDGTLSFVGVANEVDTWHLLTTLSRRSSARSSSRVALDGRRLLFESGADVTGYVGGGLEAYLYDADTDTTVCVSCRRDRQPSVPEGLSPYRLAVGSDVSNTGSPPRSISEDGRRVFFNSPNRLAVGAVEGRRNLYQWEDGQISFLGSSAPALSRYSLRYAGASADGDDVYFTTVDQLTWQDTDARLDVYDARVGGGFAEPPPPPDPCDPLAADGCHGGGSNPSTGPDVRTESGSGDGNAVSVRNSIALGRLSSAQRRRAARSGVFDLRVRTTKAGVVRVVASGRIGRRTQRVAAVSKRVGAAGVVKVRVRLSFAAVRALRSGRALRLNVRVTQAGVRARTATIRLPGASS